MQIIVFSHPLFMNSQSMPRFTNLLVTGMQSRGHEVEVWSPAPKLWTLTEQASLKKWFGYVDQYILFPIQVRRKLKKMSQKTLFVFADNALGPWVPLVADRPHVMHCHDFLAQQSGLGKIPENPTSFTGQLYQAFIRRGYRQAQNFVSVSAKTRRDLHELLTKKPLLSEVIYNGLNRQFITGDVCKARVTLSHHIRLDLSEGYLFHIGGNQWYKNRLGVIKLYNAWRSQTIQPIPLLMIGEKPDEALLQERILSAYQQDIHFITGLNDEAIRLAYQGGSLFIFPSLNEGFGWPIAEAMASGCLVLTTAEDPMREVAGDAGYTLPRMPFEKLSQLNWAQTGAQAIESLLSLPKKQKEATVKRGLTNVEQFDTNSFYTQIEAVYQQIITHYSTTHPNTHIYVN
ncbi:glycosyltransferase [uncultured Fibrella sp.]|uniref:glycosyltransferase n=1 Tax=uncultured Fibrella sp. TaxID=1284596 RepID=UPI0035CB7372